MQCIKQPHAHKPRKPKVVHVKMDPTATYIGRGRARVGGTCSSWGNPFRIDEPNKPRDGTRDTVIRKYAMWLTSQPILMAKARTELRGKNLACWCSPRSCHGDVLLVVANSTTDEEAISRLYTLGLLERGNELSATV